MTWPEKAESDPWSAAIKVEALLLGLWYGHNTRLKQFVTFWEDLAFYLYSDMVTTGNWSSLWTSEKN